MDHDLVEQACLSGRTLGGRSAGTKVPPGQQLH
jgi:hypothetical protein